MNAIVLRVDLPAQGASRLNTGEVCPLENSLRKFYTIGAGTTTVTLREPHELKIRSPYVTWLRTFFSYFFNIVVESNFILKC